jgi:transketolase
MNDIRSEKEMINYTEQKADLIRATVLEMIHHAKSGHIGSSLSCVDIISVLKFEVMNWSTKKSRKDSDVFILSKGHAVPAWYATLMTSGEIEERFKFELRNIDSPLQGHPDTNLCSWVDVSTGALAQGLSIALGRAQAKRLKKQDSYVYCIVGDGECQEGQMWEAIMYAGFRKVSNVVVFLDNNKTQGDGKLENIMSLNPIVEKFSSFNWHVQEINGHSHQAIRNSIRQAKANTYKPSVIIADTSKGYWGPGKVLLDGAHSGMLSDADYADAMAYIKGYGKNES